MNKKNLMKSILTTVGMGLATVTGVFFIKKMTTDTKDVAVGLEKDTLNKITGDSISEKEKTIKETLQCINKPESLTKNM